MIHFRSLARSFRHAFRGMVVVFQSEQNFRIQLFVALVVVLLAFGLQISNFEFLFLLVMIAAVLILELLNSIFERIVDTFKPRIHPAVRDIKDIMAAAVLTSSLASAAVGLLIFWPHLARLL